VVRVKAQNPRRQGPEAQPSEDLLMREYSGPPPPATRSVIENPGGQPKLTSDDDRQLVWSSVPETFFEPTLYVQTSAEAWTRSTIPPDATNNLSLFSSLSLITVRHGWRPRPQKGPAASHLVQCSFGSLVRRFRRSTIFGIPPWDLKFFAFCRFTMCHPTLGDGVDVGKHFQDSEPIWSCWPCS